MTNNDDIKRGNDAIETLYIEDDSAEPREPLRLVLKVRHTLDQRNMTQKELAEITGIRPNAISMLARGYVERLNLDHMERIAAAFNITDINDLLEFMPEQEARQYDYK